MPRCFLDTYSEASVRNAGTAPPRPNPAANRAAAKPANDPAWAVNKVATAMIASVTIITGLRPRRSDSWPPMTAPITAPRLSRENTIPMLDAPMCRSAIRFTVTSPMPCRSAPSTKAARAQITSTPICTRLNLERSRSALTSISVAWRKFVCSPGIALPPGCTARSCRTALGGYKQAPGCAVQQAPATARDANSRMTARR